MFDSSSRQTCRVRLATTSTPLHALTTLNDPTWVEAARVLAEHSMKSSPELDARLTHAFRRIVGRKPTVRDLVMLRRAYDRQFAIYNNDPEAAKAMVCVGAAKRDETVNLPEHAALSAVCLGILNTDEALTRE
jgi:hypothetical protein